MMDHSIQHCSYYISYRDSDANIMNNIKRMLEDVQSQGLNMYTIRLGPMSKESVNTLVSQTLVSISVTSKSSVSYLVSYVAPSLSKCHLI